MHRLLVEPGQLDAERPALSREAAHHLRVLRPRPGEGIELFDGRGRWRVCAWTAEGVLVPLSPVASEPSESRRALVLFACVTKGSRWDWTVEKATELGVTRIVPVISGRTIVRLAPGERAAKRERWLRIAEDAARQSDAKWLPEIDEAVDFADCLDLVRATDCYVGAIVRGRETPPPIGAALRERAGGAGARPLAAFVGPEGDFTPDELAALVEVATPVSFGSTILRAETAAIFAVSALKSHLDAEPR